MFKQLLIAATMMCFALSCSKVIRVQDPVVVKIVEKEPIILTEEKVYVKFE